jgi:hypothetical protein
MSIVYVNMPYRVRKHTVDWDGKPKEVFDVEEYVKDCPGAVIYRHRVFNLGAAVKVILLELEIRQVIGQDVTYIKSPHFHRLTS